MRRADETIEHTITVDARQGDWIYGDRRFGDSRIGSNIVTGTTSLYSNAIHDSVIHSSMEVTSRDGTTLAGRREAPAALPSESNQLSPAASVKHLEGIKEKGEKKAPLVL